MEARIRIPGIKLAIVGSRTFNDYHLLKETIFNNEKYEVVKSNIRYLISGGAAGADSLAQQLAKELGIAILIFYPDWSIGKSAGFVRNKLIIKSSNLVFAFQENDSKGTQHSINLAKEMNKELYVTRL